MTRAVDQRVTKLNAHVRDLERRLEDAHPALLSIPPEYLDALSAIRHFAFFGGSGERVGGRSVPAWRAPKHDEAAYAALRAEYAALERRAKVLRKAMPGGSLPQGEAK